MRSFLSYTVMKIQISNHFYRIKISQSFWDSEDLAYVSEFTCKNQNNYSQKNLLHLQENQSYLIIPPSYWNLARKNNTSNIPYWSVQAGFHHLGKVSNLVLNLLASNLTLNSTKQRMKSLFSGTMTPPKRQSKTRQLVSSLYHGDQTAPWFLTALAELLQLPPASGKSFTSSCFATSEVTVRIKKWTSR